MPYYHSLTGSNRLEYENSWSEPSQSSFKSQQDLTLNFSNHDKDPAMFMRTPVTHNSDKFSPTSPLYANQMLATPTTAFDNSEQLHSPELLMHQQFAGSSQALGFSNPNFLSTLTANLLNASSEMNLPHKNFSAHSQFHLRNQPNLTQNTQISSASLENKIVHDLFPQNMHCIPAPTDYEPQTKPVDQTASTTNNGLGLYADYDNFIVPELLSLYSNNHTLSQLQLSQYEHQMGKTVLQETPVNGSSMYQPVRPDLNQKHAGPHNSVDINELLGTTSFDSLENDSFKNVRLDQYVHDFTMGLDMNESHSQFYQNLDHVEATSDATVSPSPSQKSGHSPGSLGLGDLPKLKRNFNSFNVNFAEFEGSSGPSFSFADCSNEFHVKDYNYSFQDETAAVQKRASVTSLPKKKSISKLPKAAAKPPLRKAKTSPNLSRLLLKKSLRVLKSMESGLLSFQIPPKKEER